MCCLKILGASTSWSLRGLSRRLQGQLYLYLFPCTRLQYTHFFSPARRVWNCHFPSTCLQVQRATISKLIQWLSSEVMLLRLKYKAINRMRSVKARVEHEWVEMTHRKLAAGRSEALAAQLQFGNPIFAGSQTAQSPHSHIMVQNGRKVIKGSWLLLAETIMPNPCLISVYQARTALQTGRSQVRFPKESLKFFIDLILPVALWSWVRLSL